MSVLGMGDHCAGCGHDHDQRRIGVACGNCPAMFHDRRCFTENRHHHHETCTAVALVAGAMEDAEKCIARSRDGGDDMEEAVEGLLDCLGAIPVREMARAMVQTRRATDVVPDREADIWRAVHDMIRETPTRVLGLDTGFMDEDEDEGPELVAGREPDVWISVYRQDYYITPPEGPFGALLWREAFKDRQYELACWQAAPGDLSWLPASTRQAVLQWVAFGPVERKKTKGSRGGAAPVAKTPTEPLHLSPPGAAIGRMCVDLQAGTDRYDFFTDDMVAAAAVTARPDDIEDAGQGSPNPNVLVATQFARVSKFVDMSPAGKTVETFDADEGGVYGYWTSVKQKQQFPPLSDRTYRPAGMKSSLPRVSYAVLVVGGERAYIVGARYARPQPSIANESPEQYRARGESERRLLRSLGAKPFDEWLRWIEDVSPQPRIWQQQRAMAHRDALMYYLLYLDNVMRLDTSGAVGAAELYHDQVGAAASSIGQSMEVDAREVARAIERAAAVRSMQPLWLMPELLFRDAVKLAVGGNALAYDKFVQPALLPELQSLTFYHHPRVQRVYLGFRNADRAGATSCARLSLLTMLMDSGAPTSIPRLVWQDAQQRTIAPFCPLLTSLGLRNVAFRRSPAHPKSQFVVWLRLPRQSLRALMLQRPQVVNTGALDAAAEMPAILRALPKRLSYLALSGTGVTLEQLRANLRRPERIETLRLRGEANLINAADQIRADPGFSGLRVLEVDGVASEIERPAAPAPAPAEAAPVVRVRVQVKRGQLLVDQTERVEEQRVQMTRERDGRYSVLAAATDDGAATMNKQGLLREVFDSAMPVFLGQLESEAAPSGDLFDAPETEGELVVSLLSEDGRTLIARSEPTPIAPPSEPDSTAPYSMDVAGFPGLQFTFTLGAVGPLPVEERGSAQDVDIHVFTLVPPPVQSFPSRVVAVHISVPARVLEAYGERTSMSLLRPEAAFDEEAERSAEAIIGTALPFPLTTVPGSPPEWFQQQEEEGGEVSAAKALVIDRMHAIWMAETWRRTEIALTPNLPDFDAIQSAQSAVSVDRVFFDEAEDTVPLIAYTTVTMREPQQSGADADWAAIVRIFGEQPTRQQYAAATMLFSRRRGEGGDAGPEVTPYVLRREHDPLGRVTMRIDDGQLTLAFCRPSFTTDDMNAVPGVRHPAGPAQPMSSFAFPQDGSGVVEETLHLQSFEPLVREEVAFSPFGYCTTRMLSKPIDGNGTVYPSLISISARIDQAIELAAARFVMYAASGLPKGAIERPGDNPFRNARSELLADGRVWRLCPEAGNTYATIVRTIVTIMDMARQPRGTREERMRADADELEFRRDNASFLYAVYFLGAAVRYMATSSGKFRGMPATKALYQEVLSAMLPALQWIVQSVPVGADAVLDPRLGERQHLDAAVEAAAAVVPAPRAPVAAAAAAVTVTRDERVLASQTYDLVSMEADENTVQLFDADEEDQEDDDDADQEEDGAEDEAL